MSQLYCKLTVYFEEPFWVGVFEREENGKLETAKVTFGAEPKDYDVYDCFISNWGRLRFSPPIKSGGIKRKAQNPKRMRREAGRLLLEKGIGTKAQQALKLQHEQSVSLKKASSKQKTQEEKQRMLELKHQKQKEKHKGR